MVMTNAERQARYKARLKERAYDLDVLFAQNAQLEQAINEVRAKLNMAEIQLKKPAR